MDLLQPGNRAVHFIAANEKVYKKGRHFPCRRLQICSKLQLVRDAAAANWDEFPFHIYTYNYLHHLHLPTGRSECRKQLSAYEEFALQGLGIFFFFSSIQAYKNKNSVRVIWQILQNWLPSLRSVGQMSTTEADFKRLTLQINLLEIKISCLELSFLTWHNFGTFVQLPTDRPCISITEQ